MQVRSVQTLERKLQSILRKEGLVPCNLYGEAHKDGKPLALSFTASMSELRKLVYTPHIYVVELVIDGESHTAVLKELQFHPVTDALLHVDFYEVNDQKPITIGVPVKLVGLAQGVRDGGRMNLSIRKINVMAPYQQIPEHLDINVTELRLGKSIKVWRSQFRGSLNWLLLRRLLFVLSRQHVTLFRLLQLQRLKKLLLSNTYYSLNH